MQSREAICRLANQQAPVKKKAVLPLMSDYGVIVCEHPPEVKLDEETGGFKIAKAYRYGKVLVTVYRKGESV